MFYSVDINKHIYGLRLMPESWRTEYRAVSKIKISAVSHTKLEEKVDLRAASGSCFNKFV